MYMYVHVCIQCTTKSHKTGVIGTCTSVYYMYIRTCMYMHSGKWKYYNIMYMYRHVYKIHWNNSNRHNIHMYNIIHVRTYMYVHVHVFYILLVKCMALWGWAWASSGMFMHGVYVCKARLIKEFEMNLYIAIGYSYMYM